MTSANKEPEKAAINEPENVKQDEGEVALDPNPAKALTELVTGDETTSTDKSSSKDA